MATPRDEVAEAHGFGREGMRWWRLVALTQVPLTLAAAAGWAWEVYSEPRIVDRVVWVDSDNHRVLAQASVEVPEREAVYAAVARMWVWNLRSRSRDPVMNDQLQLEAQKLTDERAFKRIKTMLDHIEENVGKDGIEVGKVIPATVREIGVDQGGNEYGIVDVTWRERRFGVDGGAGPGFGFHAKLRIMRQDVEASGEMQPNPFNLYVVDYAFEPTGKAEFAELLP
jgi:type IV secretory pathway TrbF-like protein